MLRRASQPRCILAAVQQQAPQTLWETLADYPLFVLQLFANPRSLLRGADFGDQALLRRTALFTCITLLLIVIAFSNNRPLAEREKPRLSSFKGIVMRAHDRSFDWLSTVYTPLNVDQQEAKRLWDTLLTTGFLAYTMLAALLATALIARLRMWRYGLNWNQALGTGLLGLTASLSCIALSLVPLTLLLICRHCGVRLALFILLNLAGWAYMGYFALGDLGQRPSGLSLLLKSLGYGLLLYLLCYAVFFALIMCVIPI